MAPTSPILDTDDARFWAKVTKREDGHWIWSGATSSEGRYGAATLGGRVQPAHRVAWRLCIGEVPDGADLDHLCRVTLCVNPEHLEPVTHRENVMRGKALAAENAVKTHCKRGHEFTPETTRITNTGGRQCMACARSEDGRARQREATRRWRARQAELNP